MRIRKVRVRPWVAIFFLFNRNTHNNSVIKMAATVSKRDNCPDDLNHCLLFEVIKGSFVIECNKANVLVP